MNPWDCQSKRIYQPDGVFPTLPAMDCGGANNQAVLYALDSMSSNSMKSSNPHSGFHEETVAKMLRAGGVDPTCNQGGMVICVSTAQANAEIMEDKAPTLMAGHEHPYIASFCGGASPSAGNIGYSETVAPTLRAGAGGNQIPLKLDEARPPRKYILRRLTPLECCRLQGFPDDWTAGVEGSDAAQYKMWGNGMALPCVLYVMQGITEAGGASDADAAD